MDLRLALMLFCALHNKDEQMLIAVHNLVKAIVWLVKTLVGGSFNIIADRPSATPLATERVFSAAHAHQMPCANFDQLSVCHRVFATIWINNR